MKDLYITPIWANENIICSDIDKKTFPHKLEGLSMLERLKVIETQGMRTCFRPHISLKHNQVAFRMMCPLQKAVPVCFSSLFDILRVLTTILTVEPASTAWIK